MKFEGVPDIALPATADGAGRPVGQSYLPPLLIQYWNSVRRWRWVMIGIIAACLVAGVVITLLISPKYTAVTKIEISREQKQITNIAGVESEQLGREIEFYETQYALLRTRSLAERVASELNLANDQAFFEANGIDGSYVTEREAGQTEAQMKAARQKRAVGILLANIEISPVKNSRLVDVKYTSRSPELSAKIANKWVAAFIATSMDRQFASTADARRFLEERLASLRERLEESERQVVFYGSQSGIVSLDQVRDNEGRTVGNRTLTSANLEQLNVALNQATAARIEAEAKAQQSGSNSSDAVNNQTLGALRQQRASLAAQRAKLLITYEPDFPSVREISQQISVIDQAITRESGTVGASRQQGYREAVTRENELKARVDNLRQQLDQQNKAGIQYAIYQREADTNRQLYDALLQRYKEIGVAGTVGVNNISIAEPAIIPTFPSSPKLLLNIAIALALGMVLAGAVAFALEQIDEGVREPGQVENMLGMPMLGMTPLVENDAMDELRDTKSHLYDAYFSIRSSLAFSTNHGFPRSLAVISTRPAEGKSATAVSLAIILGRTDKRVLLVDADLRSPSVHHVVGVNNERGFSNYLAGDDEWDQLLHETAFKNVTVIAAGPVPPSAAELLSGDRLANFVAQGLQRFDHIIIDSPPVLGMTDAPLIGKVVEGVVYIVQSGGPAVRAIRASIGRLQMVGVHIFGVVLTKVGRGGNGYGYGSGYGYGYGERYGEEGGN